MKNILLCHFCTFFVCVLTKIFDPIDINSIYENNISNETSTRVSLFGSEGKDRNNKDEIGKSEHLQARVSLIDNIISKSIRGSKSDFPKSEDDQKKVLTLVELDVRNEEPFDEHKIEFTVSGSEGGKKKAKKTKTIQKTIFIKDYMANETKEMNGADDNKDFITKNEPSSILISDIPDFESKNAKSLDKKGATKHWTTIYGKDGLEKVLMDVKTITIVESIIEEPTKTQDSEEKKKKEGNIEEPFGITSKNIFDIKKGINKENGDSKEVKSKLFSSIYESLTKKASVLKSRSILGESIKKTDKASSTIGTFVHHLGSSEYDLNKTSIQISNAISQTGYKTSESSISAEKDDLKLSKSKEKEISYSLNSKSEISSKESKSISKSKEKADESISKSLKDISKEKSKSKEEAQKSISKSSKAFYKERSKSSEALQESISKSSKEVSKEKSKSREDSQESISKLSKEVAKENSKSIESVSKEIKQSSKDESKSLKEMEKSTASISPKETNLLIANTSVETKKEKSFSEIIKEAESTKRISPFTISPSISAESIEKGSNTNKKTFSQTETISKQKSESISKSRKDVSKSMSKEQEKSSESATKSMKDVSKSMSKEQEKSSESATKSMKDVSKSMLKEQEKSSESATKSMKDASKSMSKEQEKSSESATKSMKDVSKSMSKEQEKSSASASKSSINISKSLKDVSKSVSKEKEKSIEYASKISLSISKSIIEASKSISKESVKSSESFSKSIIEASKSISKESVKSSESFSKSIIEASKSISKESVKSSESISKSIQSVSKQKSKSIESKQEQKSESAKEKSENLEDRKEEKSKHHKEIEKSISKDTISSQKQQSKSIKTVSASIENSKKDTSKSLDKISHSLQKESSKSNKSENKYSTTSSKKPTHTEKPQSALFSTTSPLKVLDLFKMAVNPPTSLTSNDASFSKGLDITTSSNILIKNKQISSNATLAISQTVLPQTINSSTQTNMKGENNQESQGSSNTYTSISPTTIKKEHEKIDKNVDSEKKSISTPKSLITTDNKDKPKTEKVTRKEKDSIFTSISPTTTNNKDKANTERDKYKEPSNTHTSISQSKGSKTSLLKSKTLESISSLLQRSSILNNIKSIMKNKNVDYDTTEINEISDSSSQENNIPISSIIHILKNMPNTPDISSNKNAHEILKKVNEQNDVNKKGPVFVTGRISQGNETVGDKGDGFKFWGFISSALNNREE